MTAHLDLFDYSDVDQYSPLTQSKLSQSVLMIVWFLIDNPLEPIASNDPTITTERTWLYYHI